MREGARRGGSEEKRKEGKKETTKGRTVCRGKGVRKGDKKVGIAGDEGITMRCIRSKT